MNIESKEAAFEAVNNIFVKWKLADSEKIDILGFNSKFELDTFTQNLNILQMSEEQKVRTSLILDIHEELSCLFSNPENVYGFMKMVNNNAPFKGKRPIDLACKNLNGLSDVLESVTQI